MTELGRSRNDVQTDRSGSISQPPSVQRNNSEYQRTGSLLPPYNYVGVKGTASSVPYQSVVAHSQSSQYQPTGNIVLRNADYALPVRSTHYEQTSAPLTNYSSPNEINVFQPGDEYQQSVWIDRPSQLSNEQNDV
jgi:hypothetical protein